MPMKIVSMLSAKNKNAYEHKPVTIGFLGDSVTNGCFEVFPILTDHGEAGIDTVYEPENSYATLLKKLLLEFYPRAQINIINAGISGDSSCGGLARMDRDLIPYRPDLTVVCFGLNDAVNRDISLEQYHDALTGIVQKLKNSGSEVILMTPQPICSRVHSCLKEESLRLLAKDFVGKFHDGTFAQYMDQIRTVALEQDVPLCDVCKKWMTLYENGVDITDLLSNYLNHPTRNMHWLFAVSLAETIFA